MLAGKKSAAGVSKRCARRGTPRTRLANFVVGGRRHQSQQLQRIERVAAQRVVVAPRRNVGQQLARRARQLQCDNAHHAGACPQQPQRTAKLQRGQRRFDHQRDDELNALKLGHSVAQALQLAFALFFSA